MVQQAASPRNLRTIEAHLEEAYDNRTVCLREMRRSQCRGEVTDAAAWQGELRAVEKEIAALKSWLGESY
jgi:hypothetical protein